MKLVCGTSETLLKKHENQWFFGIPVWYKKDFIWTGIIFRKCPVCSSVADPLPECADDTYDPGAECFDPDCEQCYLPKDPEFIACPVCLRRECTCLHNVDRCTEPGADDIMERGTH